MKRIEKFKAHTGYPILDSLAMKRLLSIVLVTSFCFVFGFTQAIAQQVQISGTVTDADGLTMPGVNVLIKGTTQGTITNMDGEYNIEAPNSEATLVFSFVGFLNEEIIIGDQTTIEVTLIPDILGLDEVVVLGYTTKKKGELTGSVSTLKTEEITRTSNSDLTKSLAGKVSGLMILDGGGYPGEVYNDDGQITGYTMLIRGQGTLNNNNPLIIVDGLQVGSMSGLAPGDIENISVLKDGAAAIYGARAANGVIVITTKRGKAGKMEVNFSSNYKISQFTRLPKMMSSVQYLEYENLRAEREGSNPPPGYDDLDKYADSDNLLYPSTDWYDITFKKNSEEWRNNLSLTGGTEKIRYFVSADFINSGGNFRSDILNYNQYQVRSNIDMQLHSKVKLGVDLSVNKSDRKTPIASKNDIYKHNYVNAPTSVGIYDNGLVGPGGEHGLHPYVLSGNEAGFKKYDNSGMRGRLNLEINLDWILDGLSIKADGYYQTGNGFREELFDVWNTNGYNATTGAYYPIDGYYNTNDISVKNWQQSSVTTQLNAQLNYSKTFAGSHTVSAFIAYEQNAWNRRQFEAKKIGYLSSTQTSLRFGAEDGTQATGEITESGRVNYFGSISYGFRSKYLVDFTYRYDGSSNFPEGKRFGSFPGVSVGWVLSEESFMESIKGSFLNTLKLRASWALMGNDRVPPYQYLSRYVYGGQLSRSPEYMNWFVFGEDPSISKSFTTVVDPNNSITWETADTRNIGLSFTLLDNKLTGDLNYYKQIRKDILATKDASVPDYSGIYLPDQNFGEVKSWGYEAELAYNGRSGDFSYTLGGNFSYARNEVVFLDEAANVLDWQKKEGKPITAYYMYPTDGYYNTQEEIDNDLLASTQGSIPGDIKYVDTNNDSTIDSKDYIRTDLSPIPQIQYGIYTNFSYKGFELNILFQGQAKSMIEIHYDKVNKPAFIYENTWTPENHDAAFPGAHSEAYARDKTEWQYNADRRRTVESYMFNSGFFKLRELEFGYTFNRNMLKFADVKLYFKGYNLFSIDNIKWVDPESSSYHDFRAGLYPPLRSFTFGLNAKF